MRKIIWIVLIALLVTSPSVTNAADLPENVKWVIEPKYDQALSFNEGMARVVVNHKYGYINKSGKYVVEPQFEEAEDFFEDLAAVKINGKWGYIDKNGKVVIKPELDYTFRFCDGLAYSFAWDAKRTKTVYGFIDKKGKFVIEVEGKAGFFHEGLAGVMTGNKWGFIDKKGVMVIEAAFENVGWFYRGLAFAVSDGKYGFINTKGEFVIKPQYDYANSFFSDGLAQVKQGGRWFYINTKGETAGERAAGFFSEGLTRVEIGDKIEVMDDRGNVVIGPVFTEFGHFSEGLADASTSGKYGAGAKFGYIKNPLSAEKQTSSLEHAGLFIGEIKSVKGNEIIIGGKDIGERVGMGDRLCLYSADNLIIIRAVFPMMTTSKCVLSSGNIKEIKPGMKVYRYVELK